MLVEESVHDRFVEFVVTDRLTLPVNPLSGATAIVEVPVAPAFAVTLVGLVVTLKSGAAVTW
jgi:hypothetical protein